MQLMLRNKYQMMAWETLVQLGFFIIEQKLIFFFQWIPPPPSVKEKEAEEQITIDLGDEYEHALSAATQEEIIDLAGKVQFMYFIKLRVT